ncbi:MAG: protein kinase domain-containing protein [Ardenticatenaceae bacterium]
MSPNVCPNCAKSYRPGAYFCSNCGLSFTMHQMAIGSYLPPGEVLRGYDKYTIVRLLGQGGMGAVYLATQTIADEERYVVVKEMLDYYAVDDPQSKASTDELFEAEAAKLAKLDVDGVPQIFDYFSQSGSYYIVMEYILGSTLQKRLSGRDEQGNIGQPHPVENVRRWGIELCKLLEELAARNLVHLDIKPTNLILDHLENLWLVDFGTARTRWMILPRGQFGLQNPGIAGTTGYAPPELYEKNNHVEPRSDVYALAATLYHLLTDDDPRAHPFKYPNLSSPALDGSFTQRVPALEQRQMEAIKAALKEALNKDLTERITAREFRELLEMVPESESEPFFTWQDGTISKDAKALAGVAMSKNDKHGTSKWQEALTYFINGSWGVWFNAINDQQACMLLNQAKGAHENPNMALNAFLCALDPDLPPARLQLGLSWLDFGVVAWQETHSQKLELHNVGSGCLSGQIMNLPSWIEVTPLDFATHERQVIEVTVKTQHLTPRAQPYSADLLIDAGSGGTQKLEVTMLVPEPSLEINPSDLKLELNDERESLLGTLTVRNPGGSPFEGQIEWNGAWLTVEPAHFRCAAGNSSQITFRAPLDQIGVKQYVTKVTVQGNAGEWNKAQQAQVIIPSPFVQIKGGIGSFMSGMLIGIPFSMLAHWLLSNIILPELNEFTSAMILLGENGFDLLQMDQSTILTWGAMMGALGGGWGTSRLTDRNFWSRYLKVGAYGGAVSLLTIWLALLLIATQGEISMMTDFSQYMWSALMIGSSLMVIGAVMGGIWGAIVAVIRFFLARLFDLITT